MRAGDGAEFHNSGGDTSTEYTSHPEAADTVHNATIMESPTSIGSVEMPQVAVQVFMKPAFKILLSPVFRICNVLIVLILIPGYSVALLVTVFTVPVPTYDTSYVSGSVSRLEKSVFKKNLWKKSCLFT